MIRSLYSGVAGLKTQQTKMDVIGNNIANVGTYGYKSSRATFKDVYYQTSQAATGANGDTGGTNAIQIGYGNKVGSIDTNTATSAMASTGYTLDVAITGDGYLQVMDEGGDIYYTKAGMLDIDAEGNLVDINGNFVLGVSGDSTQPAGSNKIKINLPYLDAASGKAEQDINNVHYTIDATNKTTKANVNFTFVSATSLPIGEPMRASISGSSIVVTVNANQEFESLDDFNKALNEAVTAANNGIEHPAGAFTLSMDDESKFASTERTIAATPAVPASVEMQAALTDLTGFSVGAIGTNFSGTSTEVMKITENAAGDMTITIGAYTATVAAADLASTASVNMIKGGDADDSFVLNVPDLAQFETDNSIDDANPFTSSDTFAMTKAVEAVPEHTIPAKKITGAEIVSTDYGYVDGEVTVPGDLNSMFNVERVLDGFTGVAADADNQKVTITLDDSDPSNTVMNIEMNGYSASINESQMKTSGTVLMMKGGTDRKDAFELSYPSLTSLKNHLGIDGGDTYTSAENFTMEASRPSTNLGLGANAFVLKGGTEGGEQGVEELINISIGDSGILVGTHEVFGTLELGRIDLATFANPAGLAQSGNTYFETTFNSGDPIIKSPGDEGCGSLVSSTLESSNVDLSSEFSDMIMTQRGFQASSRIITVSDSMLEELINLKR